MRSGNQISKRGTATLDEPEQKYARSSDWPKDPAPRRDYGEDFADGYDDAREKRDREPSRQPARQMGLRFKLRASVPKSLAGRIATGLALLLVAGTGVALLMLTRSFLLHDSRFVIQSASSIEFQGNKHLTRTQLLDIFGDDVDRNIFRISLEQRQAQLEQLPWVQRATVMRLLPNRIRVSVSERTPVAFVRQGSRIGLVDASGVLLDMAPTGAPTQPDPHYSFPVITGISAADPASTRAARMKIFKRFADDLDSSGEKVSEVLSEVDLSNPEDVKALIPDHAAGILVHFGDDHFLERYRRFEDHLSEWHTQYPNLTSVDMRYEREVVLDMAGTAAAKADEAAPKPAASAPAKPAIKAATALLVKPVLKLKSKRTVKPAPHRAAVKQVAHTVPAPPSPSPKASVQTLPPPSAESAKPSTASAGARSGYLAKPAAGKPLSSDQYHPPQVPPR